MGKINYLYFGIYFVLLTFMSATGIFTKDPLHESRFFFFLYAAGQAALETLLLAAFGLFLSYFTNQKIFFAFIGITFLLFVLHVLDFLMDRVLNLSIWQTMSLFILDETFTNFLYLLDASGVPIWAWAIIFLTLTILPLAGIALYKGTAKVTKKYPLRVRCEFLPLAIFCLPTALLFWDFSASHIIHPNTYTAFLQSLPWKSTFLQPNSIVLQTVHPLLSPPNEKEIVRSIEETQHPLSSKPNIYLFVIESFRRDFITEEGAPNLFAFQNDCFKADFTLSNANATHPSWFSIFHSQFSHHWYNVQQSGWKIGSPPLNLLKKMGYQINLYSSAQLGYYGMQPLLFGDDNFLLNSRQEFHHVSPITAADTDMQALEALQRDLATHKNLEQGQMFIVFWDSTHFDYSWPKNWTPKFVPFANEFAYFKAFYSENRIHQIKNRYRNAVHYIDHLFGRFLENIPNKEEAIIIVTGDHGEEFFEHGHLFHNSHLVQEQTRIPLFMKFGSKTSKESRTIATQMDIFPTIFDHLTGHVPHFLQGQSLFQENKWPYAVISRFNAGRTPYEFCIHNGKNKMIAQFTNKKNILLSKAIKVVSLQSFDDRTIPQSHLNVKGWIHKEFGPALDRLFHEVIPQDLAKDE